MRLDIDKRDEKDKTKHEGHTNIRRLPACEDGLVPSEVEEDEAQNAGDGSKEIESHDVVVKGSLDVLGRIRIHFFWMAW
jgi:hypothetical protein